ncbi:MAG: SPOR domain-containing protein [Gammaproteobacteria bacterium]|nr:SPOR domain-containing protein [Gammaproteobacteria bacterium]
MTRDYKNYQPKSSKPLPGWLWFTMGLAVGLVVAFYIYLNGQQALKKSGHVSFSPVPEIQGRAIEQPQEASPPTQRKFDFYTLLPELEVLLPETPSQEQTQQIPQRAVTDASRDNKKSSSRSSPAYILQVGSFQKLHEADSLKAQLALLGVESNIQRVRVDRKTWYRVRIGPYSDRKQLNRIRAKLSKNKIDTLLVMARE